MFTGTPGPSDGYRRGEMSLGLRAIVISFSAADRVLVRPIGPDMLEVSGLSKYDPRNIGTERPRREARRDETG